MSAPPPIAIDDEPDASPVAVGASPVAAAPLVGTLAGRTLLQQVIALSIWPLMEQLLNFGVSFVDTALAGHLSVAASNALGLGGYLGWLINLVHGAVGVGATALIARAIGGRHRRVANAALGQAMILGLVGGIAIGGLIWLLAPHLAWLVGLRDESARLCVVYLRVVSAAAPFSSLLFVGSACLRGAGDTRSPFLVLVLVNAVNVAASVALVQAGYGVAGIAWGTFLAWALGAALILVPLVRGWSPIRLRWIRLRPHVATIRRLLRVSLPSLGEMFVSMWLANFCIVWIVGHLPDEPAALGANMIAIRAEAISFMPGFAMGIAAMTLTGQYLGAGDPAMARRAIVLCWRIGAGVMAAMGVCFVLVPGLFIRLLTDEPALLAAAPRLLQLAGFVQVFFGTAIVLGQAIRGAGDTRMSMRLTTLSTYGVRLPLAALFGLVLGWGLAGVWLGLCIELVFRGCLFAARFLHGGWTRVRV